MASYPTHREPAAPGEYPYPPAGMPYNGNISIANKAVEDERGFRTPSPTPSEAAELKKGVFDWKRLGNWRFWFRREWLWYYVALTVILVLVTLMTVFHTQIVHWLTPFANWLHGLTAGWLVPIAILFVISFPPLFGHEIVAVLCGLVWGLWVGFAIVAAGTYLGEVGNFYAFKYCCRARGEKLERTELSYACLAKVIRDGDFRIALIARLSAIPGHFTTAVFSTCGMGIITFSIAAILSLPKQFITVYLGVILEQSSTGTQSSKSRIISDVVLAVTFLVTIVAMWYIYHKMNQVKPAVIYERRKARQAKMARGDFMPYSHPDATDSTAVFNPQVSDSDIPLYQTWDKDGRAVGYAGDPRLHAPQPKHPPSLAPGYIPTGGDYGSSVQLYPDDSDVESGYRAGGGRGRSPGRQDSVDSIGWDMQSDTGSQPLRLSSTSPPHTPPQVTGTLSYTDAPRTGNEYYGTQSGGYSKMESEVNPTALGQRAFSPPPPSYRTDTR